jgi:hypothetical protein
MHTMTQGARRALATAAALVAALSLAVTGGTSARAQEKAQAKNTVLTVAIRSCEGCEVTLISYTDTHPEDGWSSDPHVIQNGKAVFVVPTDRTVGMSVMVHTPWEGQTGYATMMVFRYHGLIPGDRIGFNKARTMTKASGCWAGTTDKQYSLRFKVRRVNVQGVFEKVPGQIAWAPTTQVWLRPQHRVYGGILGAQDVILCKPGSAGGLVAS